MLIKNFDIAIEENLRTDESSFLKICKYWKNNFLIDINWTLLSHYHVTYLDTTKTVIPSTIMYAVTSSEMISAIYLNKLPAKIS